MKVSGTSSDASGHCINPYEGLIAEQILRDCGIASYEFIAELQCGEGYFTFPLSRMIPAQSQIYAFDTDKGALTQLRTKMHTTNIIPISLTDLRKLPLKNSFIHCLFMSFVLTREDVQVEFLTEVKRVLDFRGRVCIVDWQDSILETWKTLHIREGMLREWFQENGFKLVCYKTLNERQYLLVADAQF